MLYAIDLLTTRRSIKPVEMTGPGPSPAELETILTVGARVPDHGKIVPWRFIVFEGDARVRAGEIFAKIFRLKNVTATPDQVETEKKRFTHAPLVIAVVSKTSHHPKVPPREQELSAGASAMNIVHAAHALGYAGSWLTEWPTFDERARAALGLPSYEAYVAHLRTHHPERAVPSRAAFFRERQAARYRRGSSRCC